ncbi:transcriptional repressor [Hymenobacter lapidiphilus]|nr:transcriptional repressor [Hymenobacter sp. CCM 8763]
MVIDPVRQALRRHALRHTPVRRAVLLLLLESPCALSGREIERQLSVASDRITLFRTLRTFEQKGLVHRVLDSCEIVRYAISGPGGQAHVHFKCTNCLRLYCLRDIAVPAVELPTPLRVTAADYLLSGLCAKCQPS